MNTVRHVSLANSLFTCLDTQVPVPTYIGTSQYRTVTMAEVPVIISKVSRNIVALNIRVEFVTLTNHS